ncbi:MAG: TetR/AcrR family transcriptional regulator [Bacteroidota bacterium]
MPRAKQFDEEEVLEKAMLLFWKKGYFDTSITDLIDFLGISNASIYHTFGGKKQLFERAFDRYRQKNLGGLQHFLSTQDDVRKGLKGVFEKIITDDSLDEDCKGCFIANTSSELLPTDEQLMQVIRGYRDAVIETFTTFLRKGVASGQISPDKDLETLASFLYTYMMGLRTVGKLKPDPVESRASVESILALL